MESTTTWYVCHGNDVVHFIELNPGSAFESGQPNTEQFNTKEEALSRAIELGYQPDEDELN